MAHKGALHHHQANNDNSKEYDPHHHHFDGAEYAKMKLPVAIAAQLLDFMVSRGFLQPDMSVMDFGCGTGILARKVASQVSYCLGVDVTSSMVGKFRSDAREMDSTIRSRLDVVEVDLLKDQLPKHLEVRAFDVIYCSMSLHHCDNIEAAVRSLAQYLKPGGRLVILELLDEGPNCERMRRPNGELGPRGYTSDALRALLVEIGLTEVELTEYAVRADEEAKEDGINKFPTIVAVAKR
eukprot:Plantae.Rhodophyta-Rhodochaete_pulchella.ctg3030.p2 GENE.Plantae.Rhodophyta-Rhodochaete_pulchella.ctg3030~~Plantae.Rhodophyta-Rhodochaete_pulchella.ctg3030.p2  ORF type:complete len:238 (+),score=39.09 Plantae.Rhodophyta-Rhodochaete_pulchella.ctg3030:713-1426(+)